MWIFSQKSALRIWWFSHVWTFSWGNCAFSSKWNRLWRLKASFAIKGLIVSLVRVYIQYYMHVCIAWFTIWRWCCECHRKKYFFTSQTASLKLNFSTIWLVGHWLMTAMQCWNRNPVYFSVTLMLCWHERHTVNRPSFRTFLKEWREIIIINKGATFNNDYLCKNVYCLWYKLIWGDVTVLTK